MLNFRLIEWIRCLRSTDSKKSQLNHTYINENSIYIVSEGIALKRCQIWTKIISCRMKIKVTKRNETKQNEIRLNSIKSIEFGIKGFELTWHA